MRRLEEAETKRVIQSADRFVIGEGAVVTFQKNAWNALCSEGDPTYEIKLAKEGRLRGSLKNRRDILLFGVPPT
jgi:hypothetical protein